MGRLSPAPPLPLYPFLAALWVPMVLAVMHPSWILDLLLCNLSP